MKLLILGGTVFLGRHLVEAALARGHEVTLFNRGQHNPDLFPEVEKLRGDRDGGLDVLRGRRWDAVIDTSGFLPRLVRASAELLAGAVEHYTFVSSISVYADFSPKALDEDAPVADLPDPAVEEVTGESYGGLKALCELAAERAMPGRVLNVRPGLIVGPFDPIGRFAYWLRRVSRGGEVLAPGRPQRAVQLIDARDLAEWLVRMGEARQAGVFNATGPDYALTMQGFLETIRASCRSQASFTWVGDSFLQEQEVVPFDELPFWLPDELNGALRVCIDRAIAAGLTFRPLGRTARETLAWLEEDAGPPAPAGRLQGIELRTGMDPAREAALLQAWHEI